MNRTQRSLLAFFAIVILFSSSYSESNSLRYFLSAILLFFALSPAAWYKKTQSFHHRVSDNQNNEQVELPSESSDLEDEDSVDQKIGGDSRLLRLSQENVAYCISLYRLKIMETLRSYSEICMKYPDSEENDPWVLKLLKDCAKYEGSHWDHKNEKEEQEAILAYDKQFSHLFGWFSGPNSEEVVDIQIFLSVYSGACRGILRRLKYFKEIDFATSVIQELIINYSILLDCVGDEYQFTNFIKYHEKGSEKEKMKNRARSSFIKIRTLWEEIYDLLTSMLLAAAAGKLDVSQAYKELDMFTTLRDCFRDRLLSKNEDELRKSWIKSASKEQDLIFKEFYSQQDYYRIF